MQTILYVDDDENDVFFFERALKKVGVTIPVQIARDGQQAIDYLSGAGIFSDREKYPVPSLALLDLKLPYVMGLEVLKWIRSHAAPTLVVIILSASAEDIDVRTAYTLGANAFLTKPSEAGKLEDIVRAIQAFWLDHNVLPQALPPDVAKQGSIFVRQIQNKYRRAAMMTPVENEPPDPFQFTAAQA